MNLYNIGFYTLKEPILNGFLYRKGSYFFYFRCFDAIYAHLFAFHALFFCGARNVAIYAFWEPKKLNLGLRAKKTEFPALGLELRQRQLSLHQLLVFPFQPCHVSYRQ